MGSYYKSDFDKLTVKKSMNYTMNKCVKTSINVEHSRKKKWVPGPPQYDIAKTFNHISQKPRSISQKRH